MSYRKVGGLHFVRIGRFGFSFFISTRRARSPHTKVDVLRHKRLIANNLGGNHETLGPT